jgi:tRNA (cmo5U34)-methyltransferase
MTWLPVQCATAHLSFNQDPDQRSRWLSRYAEFAVSPGVDSERARAGAAAIAERLDILSPEKDEELMLAAGFASVAVFYLV